jgi:hypothetical protein
LFTGWLAAHLKDVAVLDVSWYLPADNRKPAAEFLASRIPGAQFVAIEEVVAPTHAGELPCSGWICLHHRTTGPRLRVTARIHLRRLGACRHEAAVPAAVA